MKIPKANIHIIINALFMIILGILDKPSIPMSAPANNASILVIVGGALLIIGLYNNQTTKL